MTANPTPHGCTFDELREIIRLNLVGSPRDDIARRVFGNTAGEATRKVAAVLDDPRAQLARVIPTHCPKCGAPIFDPQPDPRPGIDYNPDGPICQDDYEHLTQTGQYARGRK